MILDAVGFRYVVFLATLLFSPSALEARRGPAHEGREMGMGPSPMATLRMADRFSSELGIQSKTLDRMKELVYGTQESLIRQEADLKLARLRFTRTMDAEEPKLDDVMRGIEKVGGLETQLRKSRMRLMLSLRNLLSPEQRTKLKGLMAERRDFKREERGREGEGRKGRRGRASNERMVP